MKQRIVITLLFCMAISAYAQSEEGGSDAPDGQYPYQAGLRKKSKFLCGASIINERWLLTAAHCIKLYKKVAHATVFVGTNDVNGENGTVYNVAHLVAHEDYDKDYIHANDIALIRLEKKIQFTKKVQPVKLPYNNSNSYEGASAILAGWGTFSEKTDPPQTLQHVKVHVIKHASCIDEWKKKRNRDIGSSQLCTSGKTDENMATHGDSGGPLVSNGVQIGVVSFAWEDLPDVFVRVSSYLPWIQQQIGT